MKTIKNDIRVKKLFNIYGFDGGSFAGNVYDANGCAPAITTGCGGNREPLIITDMDKDITLKQIPHGFNNGFEYKDVCPTITTSAFEHNNFIIEKDMEQKQKNHLAKRIRWQEI